MLSKTRGIVLHHIKYSESSVIAYIYTEKFGRQSYLIKGVRGKKAKTKANILQPLFMLDMEVYHKPTRDLHNVREVKNFAPFHSIPYNIIKSTISLFLAELLYKVLREEEPDKPLFHYLINSIQLFDSLDEGVVNFHLLFMANLSKYLGFAPHTNYSEHTHYFDLVEGDFTPNQPIHSHYITGALCREFNKLINTPFDKIVSLDFTNKTREELLERLIEYYQLHIHTLKEINSHTILKEVFR